MLQAAIDQAVARVARRCWVPSDLESVTSHGTESGRDDVAEEIWARVKTLYETGMHPAIQVCIRHRGEVVLERAIGHARGNLPGRRVDPDALVPLSVDTPMNLFSAGKAVTGMVMHKLEEQGALSLDDRVADHLPGFERHGKHEITLRQVLSHRAGIPSLSAKVMDLDVLTDHDRVEDLLRDLRLSSEPGTVPAYHAITGGFVMEAVSRRAVGRSLRDVLAEDIKKPLGLDWLDFGVSPEHAKSVAQNVETGFPLGFAMGSFLTRVLGKPWGPVLRMSNDPRFVTGVVPSGNVIVTARDIASFYQCLMNGGSLDGTRVFEEDTVARAIEPAGEEMEIDRMLGMPIRYSPGFMLGSESVSLYGWNHPRVFGHVGMSNVFTWADRDRELVVALLTSGKPVLGTHVLALTQLISRIHEVFPER